MVSEYIGVKQKSYVGMSLVLYLNFFIHGMGVIVISQNMSFFIERFNTNTAGVLGIISGIGLGRLCSYFVMGFLSDRFGRRLMIYLGIGFYLLFFVGILFSPTIQIAFLFAILGGVANACLDTGTYPALMEAFPRSSGSVIVICKAAISFGQMLYPIAVAAVIGLNVWFGFSFIIPIVLLLLNIIFVSMVAFPNLSTRGGDKEDSNKNNSSERDISRQDTSGDSVEATPKVIGVSVADSSLMHEFKKAPKLMIDGLVTVLFGFSIFATFYTFVQSAPVYGRTLAGLEQVASLKLVSFYSFGSLICVFALAILLNRLLRPVLLMIIFPVFAVLALATMLIYPSLAVYRVASFVVGFTAAGGLLQLGIAVMNEFFPANKAKMTGVYMFFGSVGNLMVPLVISSLSSISYRYILLFNISVAILAVITGAFIFIRYYSVFKISKLDMRFTERWIQKRRWIK